jgi:hypothetical protein
MPSVSSENQGNVIINKLSLNRCVPTNQGPFFVYIQSISSPPVAVHPLFIGRSLNKMSVKDVLEIKKLGFSKILIQFKKQICCKQPGRVSTFKSL